LGVKIVNISGDDSLMGIARSENNDDDEIVETTNDETMTNEAPDEVIKEESLVDYIEEDSEPSLFD
jgi:hypothetical protein